MNSKRADNPVVMEVESTPPPPRHVEQLREIAALSQRVQHGLARELEVNGTALDAMEVLSREGPLTHGALAERLRVTPGAVTGLINRLEAIGHAHRETRTDRRTLWVVPSAASLERARGLMAPLSTDLRRRLGGYTTEQLALVERFLDDVASAYRVGAEALEDPEPRDDAAAAG